MTAENQKRWDERKFFLQISATKHFVSLEPLLSSVDLGMSGIKGTLAADTPDWVIVGGESGPHARPMREEWVGDVRNQCVRAGVPLFFKQYRNSQGKMVKMPELDGKRWEEMPEIGEQK